MYVANLCRFYKCDFDMHGRKHISCTHPNRKSLSGIFEKGINWLFRVKTLSCAVTNGYEMYCPLYEQIGHSSPPPKFSSKE